MSTITQLATSPASSRAQRCSVTASLNVLLSSSSLVTAVTMSIRRVIAWTSPVPLSSCREGLGEVCAPAAATTSSRVPSWRVMTSAARVAGTGPSGPSSRHSTSRAFPVRATAASWLLSAARDGGSTNAVRAFPVAYPGGAPIRSPALPFARRTVASASSTNKGTGAWVNTARSRARSALSESVGVAGSPAAASASLASTSTAASSSAKAASSRARGSAPGITAAWRSASRRSVRPTRSAYAQVSCGISPDH